METAGGVGACLPIRSDPGLVWARQQVRQSAVRLGFGLADQTKPVTAASELARDTLVHGGGGRMEARHVADGRVPGFRLALGDEGPGITDLDRALTDGLTSGGGLGLGGGPAAGARVPCRPCPRPWHHGHHDVLGGPAAGPEEGVLMPRTRDAAVHDTVRVRAARVTAEEAAAPDGPDRRRADAAAPVATGPAADPVPHGDGLPGRWAPRPGYLLPTAAPAVTAAATARDDGRADRPVRDDTTVAGPAAATEPERP